MGRPTVLIAEDDPAAREYIGLVLREGGYLVRVCSSGLEALLAVEEELPDLVISDVRMPDVDGLELLLHVRERWPGLPVVLMSVVEDVSTVVEAVRRGAVNYVLKPVSPPAILTVVEKALASRSPETPRHEPISEVLGRSRMMVEVRRLVTLAASSDVNVLIVGETGVGKELVARAIHRSSPSSAGPFVGHNCAATPPELFESQFFGHRRGAFTGAVDDHVGLVEQADGGVLLLDELEALSPTNQAKLLRVLDDGEVRPLGSRDVRRVSARFLAATNRKPRDLIAAGALREDLYYRLRGLEIWIPPLRERRDDVSLLAQHFLGAEGTFSPEALLALRAHSWPGNVRQLRNVVRSARAAAGPGKVEPRHLALEPTPDAKAQPVERPAGADLGSWHPTLAEAERHAILDALRERGGNISHAARDLGIDRSTLRRKLRSLQPRAGGPPAG